MVPPDLRLGKGLSVPLQSCETDIGFSYGTGVEEI
jgi:hypothetical protein